MREKCPNNPHPHLLQAQLALALLLFNLVERPDTGSLPSIIAPPDHPRDHARQRHWYIHRNQIEKLIERLNICGCEGRSKSHCLQSCKIMLRLCKYIKYKNFTRCFDKLVRILKGRPSSVNWQRVHPPLHTHTHTSYRHREQSSSRQKGLYF